MITIISLIAAGDLSPAPLTGTVRARLSGEKPLSLPESGGSVLSTLYTNTVIGGTNTPNTPNTGHNTAVGYQGETLALHCQVLSEKIIISRKYFLMRNIFRLPPAYLSLLFQYKKSCRDGWVLSRLESGQMGIILKHSFRRYKSMVGTGGGGREGGGGGCLHTLYMLFLLAPWILIRYPAQRWIFLSTNKKIFDSNTNEERMS